WERQNLPLANEDAFASFGKYSKSKGFTHPAPKQLAWAEGLLRAITATTDDELNNGRWEKTVDTFIGSMTFKLSLPILLEQMAGQQQQDPAQPLASPLAMEPMMRALGQKVQQSGASTLSQMNDVLKQ